MENPCAMVASVVTQAIGGKIRGKRHGPKGSEVRITAQTNVSLEHCLFELYERREVSNYTHVSCGFDTSNYFDPN